MPDGYLHVLCAKQAAAALSLTVEYPESYKAGANGPDPLFFYKIWALRGKGELYALSSRMHTQKTGPFLLELARRAKSPVCRWYARGFAVHYALDSVFHPYVAAMTEGHGAPYHMAEGHSFFESALDSYFCEKETGSPAARPCDTTPNLKAPERTWVASQLCNSVRVVYGEEHSQKEYEDAFRHIWLVRKVLYSQGTAKRGLAKAAEKSLLHAPGFITGHMQPAKPLRPLPKAWKNPYTGEEENTSPEQLLAIAVACAAAYLEGMNAYFERRITLEELGALLGSKSYDTGLPV